MFRHPALGYLGTIAFVIARRGREPASSTAARHGATSVGALARRWSSSLLPVSELAISLINLIVTAQVPPRPLPKLDMRDGIPGRRSHDGGRSGDRRLRGAR